MWTRTSFPSHGQTGTPLQKKKKIRVEDFHIVGFGNCKSCPEARAAVWPVESSFLWLVQSSKSHVIWTTETVPVTWDSLLLTDSGFISQQSLSLYQHGCRHKCTVTKYSLLHTSAPDVCAVTSLMSKQRQRSESIRQRRKWWIKDDAP